MGKKYLITGGLGFIGKAITLSLLSKNNTVIIADNNFRKKKNDLKHKNLYVHKIDEDYVPSTGKYDPYSHIFFQFKDGSHIAFFDTKDNQIANYDCADWINHISFNVESLEDLNKAKEKLIQNNIDVVGPTKHDDFITSIYFFDPNGLRLELTYQHASLQELKKYQSKLNYMIHH